MMPDGTAGAINANIQTAEYMYIKRNVLAMKRHSQSIPTPPTKPIIPTRKCVWFCRTFQLNHRYIYMY